MNRVPRRSDTAAFIRAVNTIYNRRIRYYKTICLLRMAITRLRTTCWAAPQFAPTPLDAAPAVGCTRARSCRGPAAAAVVVAAPAACLRKRTDRPAVTAPEASSLGRHSQKASPKRAEATTATRTSSLPSEATITETTWRPITPRQARSLD